ncbi:MAG: hypothetical protein RL376_1186, partial [Verrucomicrobiota bacterium]
AAVKASARAIATPAQAATSAVPVKAAGGRKLNNREQRELAELPAKIEKLEAEQTELAAKLSDPKFFKQEAAVVRAAETRLGEIEKEHAIAFARWEELEAAANGG